MKLQTELFQNTKENETTQDEYDYMLGVLPPARMTINGFLVGEPTDHNAKGEALYAMYYTHNGKCYKCGHATIKEFDLYLIPTKKPKYDDDDFVVVNHMDKDVDKKLSALTF